MTGLESRHPELDRVQGLALLAGLAALVACAGAGFVSPRFFFPSYLVAFLFWVGISLGSSALAMLHNLTGGQWGLVIRRPLEAGALTVVPMALMFVPVAIGLKTLYPWTDPAIVASHESIRHKVSYLNENAFLIRAAGGFLVWIVVATLLNVAASRRDRTGSPPGWMAALSGPGLALVFVTGSFAAIDWGMSLEPDWYSSMYGAMVIVGWGLLTFALMIVVTACLARRSPDVASVATPARMQDLGNLMLAFVMLWAYLAFSQFLIIWCGNLAEEIPWYLRRTRGGWQVVAIALIVFHFFVPFFALLFRDTKRNLDVLRWVAVSVIVMHLVNIAWLVLPAPNDPLATGNTIPWVDLLLVPLATVGIGGVWVWAFLWNLKRRPLLMRVLLDNPHTHTPHEHGSEHG